MVLPAPGRPIRKRLFLAGFMATYFNRKIHNVGFRGADAGMTFPKSTAGDGAKSFEAVFYHFPQLPGMGAVLFRNTGVFAHFQRRAYRAAAQ